MLTKAKGIARLMAVGLALAIFPFFAQAGGHPAKDKKGQTVAITGCVEKGESADEFAITQNGKKYGLKSTSVKLADHLGHKVTVTGKVTRAPGEGEEKEMEKEQEAGGEYADVQVTSLKMISNSCQ